MPRSVVIALLCALTIAPSVDCNAASRPNFLFFLVDDLGYGHRCKQPTLLQLIGSPGKQGQCSADENAQNCKNK